MTTNKITINNINKSGSFVYHTKYRVYKKKDYFECRITGDWICNLMEYLKRSTESMLFGDTIVKINSKSVIVKNSNYFKLCMDVNFLLSKDYSWYYTDLETINTYVMFNLYHSLDYKTTVEKAIIRYYRSTKKQSILEIIKCNKSINTVEILDKNEGKYIIRNYKAILKLCVAAFTRISSYIDEDHTSPYFSNKNKSGFNIEQDLELCYRCLNGIYKKQLEGELK